MGLRAANKPITDADGYATATVTRSEFGTGIETVQKSKDDIDAREYERFELGLAVDGTAGLIPMTIFAGTALNGVLEESGRGKNKKPLYNRITSIVLGLGLATPAEVEGSISPEVVERVQKGLTDLEGDRLKFKLGRVEGRPLPVPIADSIRRVE